MNFSVFCERVRYIIAFTQADFFYHQFKKKSNNKFRTLLCTLRQNLQLS